VYMSPDMLAWDVLVDRRAHGGDQGGDLEAITRRVCGGVAAGLSRLSAEARFRAPNDIAILGRKVSGSSGYAVGRSAVLQGTVLIADDVVEMARALRLPEAALRERVTCLEIEIGYAPAPADLMQCIVAGLAGTLGGEAQLGEPSGGELALCESLLRDEIGADDYVVGRSAAPA
jgi:lipoate---protein ligase